MPSVEARVVDASERILAHGDVVSVIDVLVALGWLPYSDVERWQQGRIDCLAPEVRVNPDKVARAVTAFHDWTASRGLTANEYVKVARTVDRRPLKFTADGEDDTERVYRTHWMSPRLPAAQRDRIDKKLASPPELVVVEPLKDWTCALCGKEQYLALLIMDNAGQVCMTCAHLDHLVELPSGHAALTRRAKAKSELTAVIVRFSRARKRYERQGLLVEAQALTEAEAELT